MTLKNYRCEVKNFLTRLIRTNLLETHPSINRTVLGLRQLSQPPANNASLTHLLHLYDKTFTKHKLTTLYSYSLTSRGNINYIFIYRIIWILKL